jgi:leucyl aminopeptidase (aminopeptidase T)
MGDPRLTAALVAAAATALAGCANGTSEGPASERPEFAASTPGSGDVESTEFARTLVTRCARVQEGDMVLVSGAPRDARLLEDIATEVRRTGAHALVWLQSDRLRRRSIVEVPERYDAQAPEWKVALAETATVEIAVDGAEDESLLADIAPERLARIERAAAPVARQLMARRVRQVYVGNDLRPTADRARRFGMKQEDLGRAYRAALGVDYEALEASGRRLCSAIESSREMRLTSSSGTDLRFRVDGRSAYASDGIVSSADESRGGAALTTWLPAGEAFVSAIPGTAEGRVVVDRDTWDGREFKNLVLTFRAGRLVSMTAESGGERLEAAYEAAGAGRDLFGGIDVGFNPALAAPEGSSMRSFAVAGNVTIAVGANNWLGGDVVCDFGLTASLSGTTLTANGRPIVKDGRLAE